MNLFSMGYGLSTNVEGYVRLTGEQLGTLSSLPSFGFGLKGLLPFSPGPVSAAALWFETTTTDDVQRSRFFPAKASRGGAGVSFGGDELKPSVFGGVSSVDGDLSVMAGAGLAYAPWSSLRLGIEALRGYAGDRSLLAGMDAALRVAPHIVILASPGYLQTPAGRTWTVSFGIALSTLDVDFRPTAVRLNKDEFQLPSLEDIMKEPSEEKKQ
jgi:hypothetical protein